MTHAPTRLAAAWRRLAPTRTHALAVLLIVAIAVAGGIARANVIGTNTHVSADENGYVANANRMLGGERYATFKWPPGTSVAFAVATRLSGHHSLKLATHASGPAQYMQLLIGVLTLIAVAALAWMLAGPWAAVIATALAASYEPLIDATRTFLSEPSGALVLMAATIAAVVARGRFGKSHELLAVAGAGVVGGLACLTRGDLAVGMGVIALSLALAGQHPRRENAGDTPPRRENASDPPPRQERRSRWRVTDTRGLARAGVYLGALLLTLSPWLGYASSTEKRFVPITTAGPDAFFIGSYLPGKGLLVPTEEQLAPEVCRHFPADCGRYWQHSSAPLFRLVEARHPGMSEYDAVNAENLKNIDKYALGKPTAFASMLWGKFWKMWVTAWSGGNGTYHPSTSPTQHLIYLWFGWLGLLAGALLTRRFALITSTAVLLSIAALATLFNDQPRYNVSLMALLLSAGTAGAWLAGERLIEMRRERASGRAPLAHTAR